MSQFMEDSAKFSDWPEEAVDIYDVNKIKELYENGFAGAKYSEEAVDDFMKSMAYPDGDVVAHEFGLADTGAGKLVIPFVFVLEMFPGCWPGAQGQARGDCVSWGSRNAALTTMCCDIVAGKPDEKTGKIEEKPEVPEEGVRDGVLSTEAFYWYRGYNGDGWHCPAAAKVATTKAGLFVRKNYPEHNVDLTRYSGRNAGLYGSRSPGAELQRSTSEHLIHQATNSDSFELIRDLLFNGYGIIDCGSEGYSDRRDENGVSGRAGSWAHSMSKIGVDDRDVIKQIYGGPLVLILNSWARWNSGPRDIYQSSALVPAHKKEDWIRKGIVNPSTGNVMIPEGSFWVKWAQAKNRESIAYSGANGWPARTFIWDT